jgi:hypothetical protein
MATRAKAAQMAMVAEDRHPTDAARMAVVAEDRHLTDAIWTAECGSELVVMEQQASRQVMLSLVPILASRWRVGKQKLQFLSLKLLQLDQKTLGRSSALDWAQRQLDPELHSQMILSGQEQTRK